MMCRWPLFCGHRQIIVVLFKRLLGDRVRSIFVFFLLLYFIQPAFGQDEKKINVLYINSYHNGYEWSDSIFNGVRETFRSSGKNIYLQIEYMDSKRYSGEKINEILFNYYKFKFRTGHRSCATSSEAR